MFAVNKISLDFLLGVLVGASLGPIVALVAVAIDCIGDYKREKMNKQQEELSLGKDLDDYKVPDFLPHEDRLIDN